MTLEPGGREALRIANAVLLVIALSVILTRSPETLGTWILVGGVWLFAAVEYLNYFVVRLAYPMTGWLDGVRQRRTPRLMLDARAATSASN